MGYWQRKGVKSQDLDNNQLLPFHVVLGPRDWYTMHRPNTLDSECRIGQDCGGNIEFNPSVTHRMDFYGCFERSVVQRRALKRVPTGLTDGNGVPTFVDHRQTYHPNGRRSGSFGKLGEHYDVVASFATKNEAIEFRMLLDRIR